MHLEHAKSWLKQHWILVAGGLAGAYLIYTFVLGGGASASGTTATTADDSAADQAAAATQSSNQLAAQQLADQSTATGQANQVAQTSAVGGAIGDIGTAITNVLAAQAIVPSAAIAAANSENQTALMSAASVASSGINSLSSDISAAAGAIASSYTPLATLGSTLVGLNQNIGALGESAVNAVGTSVSSSAGSAAQSAAASAQANAAATAAVANAAAGTAKVAMA